MKYVFTDHRMIAPIKTFRADNLTYIEHIFEISRRPDLLTRVIDYRTTVLKISEDDEIDTKLTRIPSAKKYKGNVLRFGVGGKVCT